TLAALAVLVAAVAVDATGLRVPRAVTRLLIVFVLLVLVIVVAVCFAIAPPAPTGVAVPAGTAGADDPAGLLPAAGVLFFAFLGTLSALLVVVGGVRRTVAVMASGGDLPATAATPGHGPLPVPASVFTGVAGVLAVLLLPPGPAIELAATGALFYYAFTNAS